MMNIIIPEVVYTVLVTIVLFIFVTLCQKLADKKENMNKEEIV